MKIHKFNAKKALVGVVCILVSGLSLAVVSAVRMKQVDQASADDLYRTVKARLVGNLEGHVKRYGDALRSLRSAAAADGAFDQTKLDRWVNAQEINVHYPAVRVFGFLRSIEPTHLDGYLGWLKAQHPDQNVTYKPMEETVLGDELAVVEMLSPKTGKVADIGHELNSEPRRVQGLDAATVSGEPSLSDVFPIDQAGETVYGMFLALDPTQPPAVKPYNGTAGGYLYSLIYTKLFFGDLARDYENLLGFELVDQSGLGDKVVFTSTHYTDQLLQGHDRSESTLVVNGRVLLIKTVATAAFQRQMYKRSPWQAGLVLGLLTVLVAWVWWRLATEGERVRARADRLSKRNAQLLEEERQLRQTVEASSRDYRALFETVQQHAIVSEADGKGHIVAVNDAFTAISGYTRDELIGQDHRLLNSGVHSKAFWADMWRSLHSGRPWRAEVCNRRKDGTVYWVDSMVTPFMDKKGRLQRCVSVRLDITERVVGAEALKLTKEQAETASRYKSQFLANMSHEIRTPMNAVLGMLQLLKTTPLRPQQLDYADKAENAAKSLLGILNDILDFSKVESGKMQLDPNPFDFEQMMKDLGVILISNLGQKRLEVLFDITPEIPQVLVGDELRLRQVLINLAGNAIKFTPQGEVIVRVRLSERINDTAVVSFWVQDTGIGISPENQKHIFDGFSQAEASTTRQYGGTGLGLSICRRLVSLMGGEMRLESRLGVGSTFSFALPFSVPESVTLPHTMEAPAGAGLNLRTLVVDDNLASQDLMVSLLQSLGWHAETAGSGALALALLEQKIQEGVPYEVVFLDSEMPGMDGWATQAAIDGLYATKAPDRKRPIWVMMVGHSAQTWEHISSDQRDKIDAFLPKPVTASSLYNAVLGREGMKLGQDPVKTVQTRPLSGIKLLLVEDNPINQQVAKELLIQQGAQVVLAENGRVAVELLEPPEHGFDLVLMDMQMPVMDGLQATHVIRENLKLADLPIVAMTANAMASDKAACLEVGMNDHVPKPFVLDGLVKTILKCCPNRVGFVAEQGARAQVESPLKEPAPTLPAALPGWPTELNASAALERLADDEELYRHLMPQFATQLAQTRAALDAPFPGNEAMRSTYHALKGAASSLGADALAQAAAAVEALYKRALKGEVLDIAASAEVATAATALDRTERSIAAWLLAQTPKSASEIAKARPDAIEEAHMLALLRRADRKAVALMAAWRGRYPGLLTSDQWKMVSLHIDSFNFEAAAAALSAKGTQHQEGR